MSTPHSSIHCCLVLDLGKGSVGLLRGLHVYRWEGEGFLEIIIANAELALCQALL